MHSTSHDRWNRGGPSCSTVRDLLPLFTDGEIDPIRARLVRDHLEGCGACREERRALDEERLWLVEAMVKSPRLSSRFRGKVIERIRHRERVERSRKRWTLLLRISGLAAAVTLAVGLGIVLRGGGASVEPPLVALNEPDPDAGNSRGNSHDPARGNSHDPARGNSHDPARGLHDPASVPRHEVESPVQFVSHRPDSPIVPVEDPPVAAGEEAEPRSASARPPSFGDVLGIVRRIGPAEAPVHPGEPCPPDPNKDGRVDLIDVAYSCQIIMGAPAPRRLGEAEAAPADPECEEDCLRV